MQQNLHEFRTNFYTKSPLMKVMAVVNAFNSAGLGVQLSGSNPTPGYAGSVIVNHIDDFGFIRYEMGYAAAISVVLLIIVYGFNLLAHRFFGEND